MWYLSLSNYQNLKQDSELIFDWLQGDEESFDLLYKRYILQVIQVVVRKTGSVHAAHEIAQETFVDVFMQREELSHVENFRGWLLAIVKHKVFNYYRAQSVHAKFVRATTVRPRPEPASVVHAVENKELLELVHKEIDQLPPRCKSVFLLSRNENLTYQDIASRLHISENTVDQHIRKALGVLKSVLKKYFAV